MKKNTFILMAMTAMFGLTSCDKELFSTENTNKTFTLFATTETGTKTALSGNDKDGYQVVWSEGDQFTVFKVVQITNKIPNIGNFTLTDGAGTTSGTFEFDGEGEIGTGTFLAYYPATDAENFVDMMSTWPATTQTYTAGKITNSPMTASFTIAANSFKSKRPAPTTVTFTNLGGILRLTVKGTATVKSIKVSAAELPTPITLDCGDGVELTSEGIDFHIAMLKGTFTGVEIALTDTEGKKCVKSFKGTDGLVVERSMITKAAFTASDFKSYNIGSKVTIGGHEGIVVDLNHDNAADVIVATMNVGARSVNGEGCLGDKMTFNAACAAWSGWRLPDVDELTTLCDVNYPACGDTYGAAGCKGAVMWDIDDDSEIDLYLPLNDGEETVNGTYPCDKYWTGTAGNGGKYFYFAPEIDWENDYSPIDYEYRELPYKEEVDTTNTYLVRLFHDLP